MTNKKVERKEKFCIYEENEIDCPYYEPPEKYPDAKYCIHHAWQGTCLCPENINLANKNK